jgi:hypothetical protein
MAIEAAEQEEENAIKAAKQEQRDALKATKKKKDKALDANWNNFTRKILRKFLHDEFEKKKKIICARKQERKKMERQCTGNSSETFENSWLGLCWVCAQ